ncbi:MAG: YitT family protein [Ruminococcaceae bacterium]|nr:YitT family protein [Oscillospiraceae bacterium]
MIKFKKIITDYTYAAIGSFILAFAISFFHAPFNISTGGVSGVAITLETLFNIPKPVSTLIINLVLFGFGFKTLKKSAILKTVIGIFMLSGFLTITDALTVYLYSIGMNFGNDILISTVFGGILVGAGVGLTVLVDASTGGSDFAAIMLHKLIPHIGVASFILAIDTTVIISSGIALGDISLMFYSALSLYISTKVTDFILIHGDFAKSVFIISKKADEIATDILEKMERGVTGIYSRGFYCNEDSTMLMCIVRNKEVTTLLKLVKKHDRNAFTIISDVKEVRGEGFRENSDI